MKEIDADDLRTAMKVLSLSLNEERLVDLSRILNETLEAIRVLRELDIPREFEPGTYLSMLRSQAEY